MTLSIIIVNFNTKKLLQNCLKSLVCNLQLPMTEIEVIVVDNNSSDNSVEFVRKFKVQSSKFKIILIENNENLGFGKAVNQGLEKAQGEYLLVLNTDTEIESGSIKALIDFANKDDDLGIVAPQLLNLDGSVQPSCLKLPTVVGAVKKFWLGNSKAFGKYTPEGNEAQEVEAVVGAVWLLPRKTLKKVGLLDEKYFMYYEDIDYCRRTCQEDLRIVYLPEAKVIHLHGASGKNLAEKPNQWLVESSRKYHGLLEHYLINLIIRTSQLCQR